MVEWPSHIPSTTTTSSREVFPVCFVIGYVIGFHDNLWVLILTSYICTHHTAWHVNSLNLPPPFLLSPSLPLLLPFSSPSFSSFPPPFLFSLRPPFLSLLLLLFLPPLSLTGEPNSSVTAHLSHDTGILMASIRTSDGHYYIEPSHRHFPQPHDFHMISYRAADLKYNLTRYSVA